MNVDKTIYWLYILFRGSLILLALNASANTHPLPFYPWKDSCNRHLVRSTPESPKTEDQPIPISYKLDRWSQYDNPEEGCAREGDIRRYPSTRKSIATERNLLWPDGVIRYFVNKAIVDDLSKLTLLENAMENIMELTCIKFVRIYPDSQGLFPCDTWVNITGDEEGCFSDLGRSLFGGTKLNLNVTKCFRTKGHALHEILHTLGVFHEHMRPDRDQHITILWNNIKEDDIFNFLVVDIHKATDYGLPYDYDSVMHYSMTAFSKNKSMPTIVPKKKGVEIGQRSHLSIYDVRKLLIAYQCKNIDMKNIRKRINQFRNDDESLLKELLTPNDVADNRTKNIGSSAKIENSPREFEPTSPRSIDQTKIRITSNPPRKCYYSEYYPKPLSLYYYCQHYGLIRK